jgi:hypothetical protein
MKGGRCGTTTRRFGGGGNLLYFAATAIALACTLSVASSLRSTSDALRASNREIAALRGRLSEGTGTGTGTATATGTGRGRGGWTAAATARANAADAAAAAADARYALKLNSDVGDPARPDAGALLAFVGVNTAPSAFDRRATLRATWFPDSREEVRSIHWSPYDRVGVVNADP